MVASDAATRTQGHGVFLSAHDGEGQCVSGNIALPADELPLTHQVVGGTGGQTRRAVASGGEREEILVVQTTDETRNRTGIGHRSQVMGVGRVGPEIVVRHDRVQGGLEIEPVIRRVGDGIVNQIGCAAQVVVDDILRDGLVAHKLHRLAHQDACPGKVGRGHAGPGGGREIVCHAVQVEQIVGNRAGNGLAGRGDHL